MRKRGHTRRKAYFTKRGKCLAFLFLSLSSVSQPAFSTQLFEDWQEELRQIHLSSQAPWATTLLNTFSSETLSSLNLESQALGDEGVRVLAKILSAVPLTELNLENNRLSERGAKLLSTVLDAHQTLTALSLRYNAIGPSGASSVARLLASNSALSRLDLFGNQLEDQGGIAIAGALEGNTTLTFLDLGNNQIGVTGGVAIATALFTHPSLRSLGLLCNEISDPSALVLASVLKKNTTLTELVLTENHIQEAGIRALLGALQHNTTLRLLALDPHQMREEDTHTLEELLARNQQNTHEQTQIAPSFPLKEALEILEKMNPALKWKMALKMLFPPVSGGAPVSIGTLTSGLQGCHPALGPSLLLNQPHTLEIPPYTFDITPSPQLPGLQHALSTFLSVAFSHGMMPAEVFRALSPPQNRPFAAALKSDGDTFDVVLREHPALLFQLDPERLSDLTVGAILLGLHAPDPSSYTLSSLPQKAQNYSFVLHGFPFGLLSDAHKPLSALYALEHMVLPFSSLTRARILEWDAAKLLRNWLAALKPYGRRITEIFPHFTSHAHPTPALQRLGLPLTAGRVSLLYHNILALQTHAALTSFTPLQALQLLLPQTGELVKRLFDTHPQARDVQARLRQMPPTLFPPHLPDPWQPLDAALDELTQTAKQHEDITRTHTALQRGDLTSWTKLEGTLKQKVLATARFSEVRPGVQEALLSSLIQAPLTILTLHESTALTDQTLKNLLKASPHLTHLTLSGMPQLTRSLQDVETLCPQLTHLTLQGIPSKSLTKGLITASAFVFPGLESLDLSHNAALQTVKIEAPILMQAVFENCTRLKGTGLLLQAPQIISLNLKGCPLITGGDVDTLSQKFPRLQKALLTGTSVPYAALRTADLHFPTTLLRPPHAAFEPVLLSLLRHEGDTLELGGQNIDDTFMPPLAQALERNVSLQTLLLDSNLITSKGLKSLIPALKVHPQLTTLSLTQNQIDVEGAQALGHVLPHMARLHTLSLSNNPLANEGTKALTQGLLQRTTSSFTLNLRDCLIRRAGGQSLSTILHKLIALDIGRNQISDDGANALAAELTSNTTLTDLNLRDNHIGEIGGHALAQALRTNMTLRYLDTHSNAFTPVDQAALQEMLTRNQQV